MKAAKHLAELMSGRRLKVRGGTIVTADRLTWKQRREFRKVWGKR